MSSHELIETLGVTPSDRTWHLHYAVHKAASPFPKTLIPQRKKARHWARHKHNKTAAGNSSRGPAIETPGFNNSMVTWFIRFENTVLMLYACFASEVGGIVHCHWPTRETLHTCQGNRWASIFAKSFKPPLRFGAYYLDPGLNVEKSKSTKASTCFLNSNPHFFLQHFVGNRLQSRLGLSNLMGRDQARAPQTDSSSSSLIAIFYLVPSPWVPISEAETSERTQFLASF